MTPQPTHAAVPDLLDREAMLAALSPAARAQLACVQLDDVTESTQTLALAAPVPDRGCALWLAERQTAGQGQRGRAWSTPAGAGLAMSLSRRFGGNLPRLSGLSLAVGASIAETLRRLGYDAVGVKWPNDLVAEGRKLGGILIQLRAMSDGGSQAVIGLGLNVRMPTAAGDAIDQPWCDLASLRPTAPPPRTDLAAAILEDLLTALQAFDAQGLPPFLARWRALDALAGRPVRVTDATASYEGVALGISDGGALRVSHAQGERLHHSGDVSLRPA